MKIKLIDTHCHFNLPPFYADLKNSIEKLQKNNVDKLIIPATGADEFDSIIELSHQAPQIYTALGLHPLFKHKKSDLDVLTSVLSHRNKKANQKIVAVGEIGLDFYPQNQSQLGSFFPQERSSQIQFFKDQCAIAKSHDLPIILHERKAHQEIIKIIKQHPKLSGVIHAFSGSYEQAMDYIRLGFFIGIGGLITYPRAQKTRKTIAQLPIEFLLLETDAPYMPLNGFQGEPNRPERINLILQTLAELRDIDEKKLPKLAEQLYQNSQRAFPKLR